MQIVDQDQFSWYRYYNITLETLAEINKINFSVQIYQLENVSEHYLTIISIYFQTYYMQI